MEQQNLTFVGLTADKQRLVMVNDAGAEYSVAADATLRAALRGDHTRLGQLEIQMESSLRPRDIQSRIRAGESPEAVAAAAQAPIERIMGYATPVLAERAHIAGRAQRGSIRRKAGDGASRVLSEVVGERLRSRNLDPTAVEWDSWRREDGRWTLVADYLSGDSPRHAEFTYDVPGRYVIAEDEEARWLVGDQSTAKGPQPRIGGTPRRLAAVSRDDDLLPLGEDAIGLVREPEANGTDTQAPVDDETTEDLSEATQAAREQLEEPERGAAEATPAEHQSPQRREVKKNRGRASVPSWDEIMFGGSKND